MLAEVYACGEKRKFLNSLKPHQALLVGGGRQVSDALAIHAVAVVLVIVSALRGKVLLVQLHSRAGNSSQQVGNQQLQSAGASLTPAVARLQSSSSSLYQPFYKLPA